MAKLKMPGVRDKMRQDIGAYVGTGGASDVTSDWAKMKVVEVRQGRNFQYEGKTIAELSEMTGKHPMDAMLDLALDEDLRTEFTFTPAAGTDPKAVAEILNPPLHSPLRL